MANIMSQPTDPIQNYGEKLIQGETEHGTIVTVPIQFADVQEVVMSTHEMNETGVKLVLYGVNSYFIDKLSGNPPL